MANKDYIQANKRWLAEKAKEERVISEAFPGLRRRIAKQPCLKTSAKLAIFLLGDK